jgi:SAM-dependent methyltransferase
MTDVTAKVREHYSAAGLTNRIKSALAMVSKEGEMLSVAQLAPLDQFHSRGILSTTELAGDAKLNPSSRVLDVGCGIGGPARYIAATYNCQVTGVDLSADFVEAATYLTARCGLSGRVTFQVGDALSLPFEAETFDTVFLQHVAMNISDRMALYAEMQRILRRGGRFAMYDLVLRDGDVVFPTPWARDPSTSFLLSESDTRAALEQSGFTADCWRDNTEAVSDWFARTMAEPPTSALNLSVVMGPDFRVMTGNLARSIRENRLGVLSAILKSNRKDHGRADRGSSGAKFTLII